MRARDKCGGGSILTVDAMERMRFAMSATAGTCSLGSEAPLEWEEAMAGLGWAGSRGKTRASKIPSVMGGAHLPS